MAPHGICRVVQRLELYDCKTGLGVKIIGGYRGSTGDEFGIYIKRVIPGGLADLDGRLKSGDLLLDVNDISLVGVTNDKAVEILRTASFSNHMSLLIARDDESRKEFSELMEKYGASVTHSGWVSPTQTSTGKPAEASSSPGSSRSESPQSLLLPRPTKGSVTTTPAHLPPYTPNPTSSSLHAARASTHVFCDGVIQLICVSKVTGLGLLLKGGADRSEGPMVFIHEIVPGGDSQKDGRLQAGDQLVSINQESLIGLTYEEASDVLTRTKLRPEPTVEIAFIRRTWSSSSSSRAQSPGSLQGPPAAGGPGVLQASAMHGPVSPSCRESVDSQSTDRKLSIPSISRIKVERLEQALDMLGLQPTECQWQALCCGLHTDPAGTVDYADFEALTRELFGLQWEEEPGVGPGSRFMSDDLLSLLESPTNLQASLLDLDDVEEMERLKTDHIEALREIKKLQDQLLESQKRHHHLEEELTKIKMEVKAGVEESRALRSRIQLAEEAQRDTRGMEMDYEEVIHLLETEIAELKTRIQEQTPPGKEDATEELKKKVAVLECQLRKTDGAKRGFEISTGKLLSFVETLQEFLVENHQGPSMSYSGAGDMKVSGGSSAPLGGGGGRCRRGGPWTSGLLAQEARELARTVRAVLDADCLPYGWEEAYTPEGAKYYINHVTQTTSWSRPVGGRAPTGPPKETLIGGEEEEEEERKAEPSLERRNPSVETEM